ncbi:MAG TPA: ATP-binding protein [Acidobacteriaceae bacterium]|jgi:nitrogen fixation/metabolism regulation signal transduction histidine kinase|nr:ATP-binding protein [Acidobacteriaceae bacterium]
MVFDDSVKNPHPSLTPNQTPESTTFPALEDDSEFIASPPARLRFEVRLRWLLLLLALPGIVAVVILLMHFHLPALVSASILGVVLLLLATAFFAVLDRIVRPLQVLSNVVAALREDDYSFRARHVRSGDALGDLADEINQLADHLQIRRHAELEASALLARVVETMDLPVFAFDAQSVLRLTNPAAARMLGRTTEKMLHLSAEQLGLTALLQQPEEDLVILHLADRETRWMVRRSRFYQNGVPHRLLLLSDVSGVLRGEERRAWQRLIRVLAHEVNNSLTPIKSIAGSLRKRTSQALPVDGAMATDFERGLSIVEERAESLNRFLQAYGQLAKLPSPIKVPTPLAPLIERVRHLELRIPVELMPGPDVAAAVDVAQMEQVLINLIRNAVDAATEPTQRAEPPWVEISWQLEPGFVRIRIKDNGPGLTNPANLFVPFYTTKTGGSGIGLILARQIVDLHGGTLSLRNRKHGNGCHAELRLPVI